MLHYPPYFWGGNMNYIFEDTIRFDALDRSLTHLETKDNISLATSVSVLLEYFIKNQGAVIARDTLLDDIFKKNELVDSDSNLSQNISMLRKGFRDLGVDKDILVKGNKMYSEETCCFIPDEINCLIGMKKNRGKYPAGVTWNKGAKAFRSKVRVYGKDKHLGYYKTSEEAFYAYKKAKEQYVKEVANNWKGQIDNKVYEALMNWEININD